MAVIIPAFADLKNTLTSAIKAKLSALLPNGASIQPDFSQGSAFDAITDAQAITALQFYGQLDQTQKALTLDNATGADLRALVKLVGYIPPNPAAAIVPVKFSAPAGVTYNSPQTVPITTTTVLANDATGQPTIQYAAIQDPTQSPGIAATLPAGASSVWALCQCTVQGSLGNIGAGAIALPGSALPWCGGVSNPAVGTPAAPTVTPTGTAGSTTYQYQIVARGIAVSGVSGTTLPSPTGQTTTGNATLTTGNYNALSWTAMTDATSYDVLRFVSGAWQFLTNVATPSYNDTGAATPTAYALPTANSTNAGVGGVDQLTDAQIRTTAPQQLAINAKSTSGAILGAVEAVSGVTTAYLQDAGTNGQATGTFTVFVVPTVVPAPSTVQSAVSAAVAQQKGAGIVPTITYLTPVLVDVAYTFAALAGQNASSLVPAINSAITAYLASVALGGAIRYSQVLAAIVQTSGVAACTTVAMTVHGGSTFTNADVPGVTNQIWAVGSLTSTVGS